MGHGVRQIEEEWPLANALDESDSALGVQPGQLVLIGQRADFAYALVALHKVEGRVAAAVRAAVIGRPRLPLGRDRRAVVVHRPHVVRIGEAEVLVEALLQGEVGRLVAEMPFANHRGGVAAWFQHLGNGVLFGGETAGRIRTQRPQHIHPHGVAAGEQGGARRAADRLRDEKVGEAHAFGGEAIHVGGDTGRSAEAGGVGVAHVVHEDDDEIGRRLGGSRAEDEREQCTAPSGRAGRFEIHDR